MSEERVPQRPEGIGDTTPHSTPRVEVEPTPSEPVPPRGVASEVPPTFETVRHTVVKTRTKKVPVFIASLAGLVVGAVLVIALVMTGAFRITDTNVEARPANEGTQTIKIDPEDTTLPEVVAAKAQPSVVSITAMGDEGGVGSGVVLDKEGNILTNYHVIANASALAVSMGGESYEAEVVGSDPSSDLAVIKIKDVSARDLTPIEIGDSDDLKVGEWVMAIGSPFGNEQSVSTGIVSALYRSTALPGADGTSIYANMIQTDAAINPGNSGGALVNDQGKLIGINSIIESYSGSSSGVGFAIPVNYAIDIANQIIDGKTPVHPYLGATLTSVNALTARQSDLSVNEGALVIEVAPGGPAEEAGLMADDVVTAVDGESIISADGLIIALREREVGDTVKLTVARGKETVEIEVTLGSDEALQAEQRDAAQGDAAGNSMTEEEFLRYLQELLGGGMSSERG
ncbi:MAG: trypsin-like peptidase domain-containing protein [Collinsella sp.]|nr:trypsin-like peptidase domain-containing protein [Collinsella sp.]